MYLIQLELYSETEVHQCRFRTGEWVPSATGTQLTGSDAYLLRNDFVKSKLSRVLLSSQNL